MALVISIDLIGVVRNSDWRRCLYLLSCHSRSRSLLRASAVGLLLFLFCTAADRSITTSSSQGLHMGVEGAGTTGVGAGNPCPQLGSRGEVGTLSKLSSVFSLFFSSSSK